MGKLPPIIGLCGDIGSGKSTVAGILESDWVYTRGSWATKLKEVVMDLYGVPKENVYGRSPETAQADKAAPLDMVRGPYGEPRSARKILEMLGTDACREIDPDVWVKYLMRKFDTERSWSENHFFVVDDCRFTNEFKAIRARGGVVWEVQHLGVETERTGHRSDEEWRSLPKDAIIAAETGDLETLRVEISKVLL